MIIYEPVRKYVMGVVESKRKIPDELALNDFPVSVVPANTIKRGYDVYQSDNYGSLLYGHNLVGDGDDDARDCGKVAMTAKSTFLTDGRLRKGDHRHIRCGLTCRNCDAWPNQSNAKKGPIKGVKVPIGVKLDLRGGNAGNSVHPSEQVCSGNVQTIKYAKDRVPENIATMCAGGSNLPRGHYLTTDENKFTPVAGTEDADGNYPNQAELPDGACFAGTQSINIPHKTWCIKSDVDMHTFCQMGDYVDSQECREYCVDNDCTHATDRICRKIKGDPIKKDASGNLVLSDKNYLRDSDQCYEKCGGPSDPRCKDIKNEVCQKADWNNADWAPEYCRDHWRANPDDLAVDKACGAALAAGDVFKSTGCGKLCQGGGLDVSETYCNQKKADYCLSSKDHMFTDQCYDFCSSNPDICDNALSGAQGMCAGVRTQADLDAQVPGTIHTMSDWCGCMMPSSFYQDYAKNIDKKFNDFGYSILGQVDVSPECMYPQCKQGSVMTSAQHDRKASGMCTDCVQIMLQTLNGSFVDNNIVSEQSEKCANIKQVSIEPGVYDVKGLVIDVAGDGTYCVSNASTSKSLSKIPDGYTSRGDCVPAAGTYTTPGGAIKVHADGTYCKFPEGVVPDGAAPLTGIPMRVTLSDQAECPTGDPTPVTPDDPPTDPPVEDPEDPEDPPVIVDPKTGTGQGDPSTGEPSNPLSLTTLQLSVFGSVAVLVLVLLLVLLVKLARR